EASGNLPWCWCSRFLVGTCATGTGAVQSRGRHPERGWRPWSAPCGRGTATRCGGWVDTAPPLSGRGGQGHGVAREPARRHCLPCVTGSGTTPGVVSRPAPQDGKDGEGLLTRRGGWPAPAV